MSEEFLANARRKGLKAVVVTAIIGVITGYGTRLVLAGHRTNEQIMASRFGLIAFLCIGMGIYGIGTAKQQIRPFRLVGAIFLLAGGIMWVVPLPH
ncbi:MAG TPA: hypothetical protein VJ843_05465 [Candidatus Saccharimonadales bacterium]|nr:hypothetical protein [Candidatus Saccharimonadales bacterium]